MSVTVDSWEGGRSQVDSDIAKERKAERKRRWSDGYEEELDMGKVWKYTGVHTHAPWCTFILFSC